MYTYTIRTDAVLTSVDAETIDDAARLFAASEFKQSVDTDYGLAELLAEIEGIDGAWLWIESDDAPDGVRQYAGKQNM